MELKGDSVQSGSWAYIRQFGLRPELDDPRDPSKYLAAIERNLELVKGFLRNDPRIVLDPLSIKAVHREIFSNIYLPQSKVAGEYTPIQLVLRGPGLAEVYGSLPHLIERNVAELCATFEKRFQEAKTEPHIISTAVEFHVQFKAIQAFCDGNGRTAGVLLEHQLSRALQRNITLAVNADDYRRAMWLGVKYNDIAPVRLLINRSVRQSDKVSLNFFETERENAYATGGELKLKEPAIIALGPESLESLLSDRRLHKINGLTRESLKQEFDGRANDDPAAAAHDVKTLLKGALEREVRHEQKFERLKVREQEAEVATVERSRKR